MVRIDQTVHSAVSSLSYFNVLRIRSHELCVWLKLCLVALDSWNIKTSKSILSSKQLYDIMWLSKLIITVTKILPTITNKFCVGVFCENITMKLNIVSFITFCHSQPTPFRVINNFNPAQSETFCHFKHHVAEWKTYRALYMKELCFKFALKAPQVFLVQYNLQAFVQH